MNLEALQEQLQEQMSEMEDEIIVNRVNFMLNKDCFLDRFFSLDCMTHKRSGQTADNIKQEIADFLIDEMDVNG